MRRILVLALLAVVAAAGITALSSSMKFRTDRGPTGSRTLIHFTAESRHPAAAAALRLWEECASIANHVRLVAGPRHDGTRWTVVLEPALGPHTERRLTGCLDDLTVDGIRGHHLATERLAN
ncbi:hypothetical protein [Nocardia cyriacigeorgica]|uniref:Uncharacterized protein n=1 Tax=Nocardia cyriacigeorgica TaxID=135487 RepID=A0A5R8NLV5_9NOCA|nr:hypothetical protein [Nocardia cyriacigeorgica]TLF76645.1 hypothetical protein FEK34_17215 [Nocardia cyriacigeorgica]